MSTVLRSLRTSIGLVMLAAVGIAASSGGFAAEPAAAAGARVVHANGDGWVTRFGPLRTGATQRAAWRAFGRPQQRKRLGSNTCRAKWTDDGVELLMTSYGGQARGRICGRNRLYVQTATVSGHRWRTDRGLYADDRAARIAELYPSADGLPEAPEVPDPEDFVGEDEALAAANASYGVERTAYEQRLGKLTRRITLEQAYFPYGDGGIAPTVSARVRNGTVRSFEMWIGGAGE